VTFLAFQTANIAYSYAVTLLLDDFLMVFLVDAVELVTLGFIVTEIHFSFTVAVYTPSHAQLSKLVNFVHFGDFTMAGLALHLAGLGML
jgi:hypothetical protein